MKKQLSHPASVNIARKLRRTQTPAEKLFWQVIKNRQVANLKFKRQHPVGPFIVDFYCHEASLIIEVDGDVHDVEEIKIYDKQREAYLKNKGYSILRFTNEEVVAELDRVVREIEKVAKPSPYPLSKGED